MEEFQATDSDDVEVIAEADLEFAEMSEVAEGMCSCVCINDEQCCGCILQ